MIQTITALSFTSIAAHLFGIEGQLHSTVNRTTILLVVFASLILCPNLGTFAKDCEDVKCQKPPEGKDCKEMDEAQTKPKYKKADCCPVWKCKDGNADFFTFHGLDGSNSNGGGTETTHYSDPVVGPKGSPIHNTVTSVATGQHSATALAGDGNKEDVLKEMAKAFEKAGLPVG